MGIDKGKSMSAAKKMRLSAEKTLNAKTPENHIILTNNEAERLFHELQVHEVELELQNVELRQAREELELMHARLASHAAELEAANIELEAFNYSVSHDLRSPLTIINSYCQVMQEQANDILDVNCRGYLREMFEGTVRMNQLIDTLLDFSRVKYVELSYDTVDLTEIAHEVVLGLQDTKPEQRGTFRIDSAVVVVGDASLLRVVLDNLIGNALKYSGNHVETIIDFGVSEVDGKQVCFVRDNGLGFDMAFAEKLFIPFQRLSGNNVRGNGIGLATVSRIIKRHGGRVWAESAPGKGSTFFFTLE